MKSQKLCTKAPKVSPPSNTEDLQANTKADQRSPLPPVKAHEGSQANLYFEYPLHDEAGSQHWRNRHIKGELETPLHDKAGFQLWHNRHIKGGLRVLARC